MSYSLPPVGHKARDLFDLTQLVAIGTGKEEPVFGLPTVLRLGRDVLAANPAAVRVNYIVCKADDSLELVSVGRRGGWTREWRFGTYRRPH